MINYLNDPNTLISFLGDTCAENLREGICNLILDRVKQDLDELACSEWVLDVGEIQSIASEALDEVKDIVKEKYKEAYLIKMEEFLDKHLEGKV